MKTKFWKQESWRSFWLAFALTLLVMTPGLAAAWAVGVFRQEPAAESKSGVPIRLPDESHQLTVLAVVAGEKPAFTLVRLDAVNSRFVIGAIPSQSVVRAGAASQTLAECYATAGPARAARLLSQTLNLSIDRYISATPETWQAILEDAGPVRVGLNGALNEQQRKDAGLADGAESWTVTSAHNFLASLEQMTTEKMSPQAIASARAALWQGWARQKLDLLPGLLPAGLKKYSGRLLTDLTATENMVLEKTLEFLADSQLQPVAQVLPGTWNQAAQRYEFNEETVDWLHACFNSAAKAQASDSNKEP